LMRELYLAFDSCERHTCVVPERLRCSGSLRGLPAQCLPCRGWRALYAVRAIPVEQVGDVAHRTDQGTRFLTPVVSHLTDMTPLVTLARLPPRECPPGYTFHAATVCCDTITSEYGAYAGARCLCRCESEIPPQ